MNYCTNMLVFIQHVDEAVNSQLKERFQDKITRLQKGEKKVFEDMFAYACPKFISPIPPDYDSLPENYNKVGVSNKLLVDTMCGICCLLFSPQEPTQYQCSVFMAEIEQQLILPVLMR